MQRQGGGGTDVTDFADEGPALRRTAPSATRRPGAEPNLSPPARVVEFGREVRSELRQVAWPTRSEVANSATVVIIVLVLLVALIFLLNYAFSHGVLDLLHPAAQ
ncbi:MAG TPA: preprotein translocase subunit SecE [Acidimicrobiales bacterium]|nr:preprotein translocase subunit SecE [Acidimicrobiales bacterium]